MSIATPKSILKVSNSRLRPRSKSVSFDLRQDGDSSNVPATFQRALFMNGQTPNNHSDAAATNGPLAAGSDLPVDLTTSRAQLLSTSNDNSAHASNSASSALVLTSGEIQSYENRIDGLVKANQAKINRVRELQVAVVERDNLLSQVESLHRLNLALTQTVDAYNAQNGNLRSNESNVGIQFKQKIGQLEAENDVLRSRVSRLNQQVLNLQTENKRLNDSLGTHSKKVLAEHNYNL